jgi:sulfur-carrier protein adenylyltransferase/sulfurtransferase
MPESDSALSKRFNSAIAAVEARWWHLSARAERLTAKELANYRKHEAVVGWRLRVEFSDGIRKLDVFVSAGFPFVPARIALVDRSEFVTWPHIDDDGVLCLLPDHGTVSIDDPYDGVSVLLGMAYDLIEGFVRGGYEGEFRVEFLTYWANSNNVQNRTVLSLIEAAPPSRIIKVWEDRKRIVIADGNEQLQTWLRNLNPDMPLPECRVRNGVLLWLDEVPLPSEYPSSAKEVYAIAARAGAAELLDTIAREVPDRLFVLIGAMTKSGPAIVATVVKRPPIARDSDPLVRGFRPSQVPEFISKARFFGAESAGKNSVDRVDSEWIHGRGQDPRLATLQRATVAVLGCGSVGAPVAINLARAGVGKLILVDQQMLKGANVGRHPLGVSSIDSPKASELAKRLRGDLPHMEVVSHISKVQTLLLQPDCPLAQADLIVSALGDWASESMLDEWHVANGRTSSIVYGWTEPHAAAGHAVIVSPSSSRLLDGLNSAGQPHLIATQWAEETRRYEPACGAAFEPYGPVELGFITSLISQAALDCLLGSIGSATHRIWLARRNVLEGAGGRWSQSIREIAPHALDGGTMLERRWGQHSSTKVLAA